MKNDYQGIIFLKDQDDLKMLKEDLPLYGQVIECTKTVFMTPYSPPTLSFKKIGIIAQRSIAGSTKLIDVFYSKEEVFGIGHLCNQRRRFPIKIVFSGSLYERTPFKRSEMDCLGNKKVLIFGCGTGGSKIALELARAGVSSMTICDPDKLEFANVSRHEGDLQDIGKYKTHLTAERIYRINPSIKVKCYPQDIFDKSLAFIRDIFGSHDLVVAATDRTAIQLTINEMVQQAKVPCVFGGCYENAIAGEVFFTLPNENMPCLCCLRGGLKQPKRQGSIDYSTASGPEDYKGQPGLHAMVDFITCSEVMVCLAILLRDIEDSILGKWLNPAQNLLLVGTALSSGFYRFKKPFDIFFQPLSSPRKNCSVCGEVNLNVCN